MPGGRPSKYDPAYCDAVVEFMAEGYSLTAFAGSIRVARSTVNLWEHEHPEFSEATKIGHAARTAKLEQEMMAGTLGPYVTARIFALKNAAPDEWRDKREHEHSGPGGAPLKVCVEFVGSEPDGEAG